MGLGAFRAAGLRRLALKLSLLVELNRRSDLRTVLIISYRPQVTSALEVFGFLCATELWDIYIYIYIYIYIHIFIYIYVHMCVQTLNRQPSSTLNLDMKA